MKLSCALVACNENTHYLDFWPVVRTAWWNIVGIPCIMVYVGEELPECLIGDPAVVHFQPIANWPTATQAQCIRLLYPSLLECDGAIILSDMDIVPLQKQWFIDELARFDESKFVSLRGIDEPNEQVYMCYVAAQSKTWADLFNIHSVEDIRERLMEWSVKYFSNGTVGGYGWCTDQIVLYKKVKEWETQYPERVGLLDFKQEISRIDRSKRNDWNNIDESMKMRIKNGDFIDFHMPSIQIYSNHIINIVNACIK
jgi:hypothetical protein